MFSFQDELEHRSSRRVYGKFTLVNNRDYVSFV